MGYLQMNLLTERFVLWGWESGFLEEGVTTDMMTPIFCYFTCQLFFHIYSSCGNLEFATNGFLTLSSIKKVLSSASALFNRWKANWVLKLSCNPRKPKNHHCRIDSLCSHHCTCTFGIRTKALVRHLATTRDLWENRYRHITTAEFLLLGNGKPSRIPIKLILDNVCTWANLATNDVLGLWGSNPVTFQCVHLLQQGFPKCCLHLRHTSSNMSVLLLVPTCAHQRSLPLRRACSNTSMFPGVPTRPTRRS